MPTTTELTENYLREHPSIKDCLKKGIINYSRLARRIAKELGIEKKTSTEAILIACRRFAIKIKTEQVLEEKILSILKRSELEIKNKIVAIIIGKKASFDSFSQLEAKARKTGDVFYFIEGSAVFTVIASEKYRVEMQKIFHRDIVKVSKQLAMVILKSPEDLENTPGVVSYLYSLVGEQGINIVETMSCWTDTIFIIEEKDLSALLSVLRITSA